MISYCTTLKDRIEHLVQTLPKTVAAMTPTDELIIMDYGSASPDVVRARVKEVAAGDRRVFLYRYETRYWRVAHAKNITHRMGINHILCNLDADNWITEGFSEYLRENVNDDLIVAARPRIDRRSGSDGRIALTDSLFNRIGGYDERMEVWGCDATDLKCRACRTGAATKFVQIEEFLDHDDGLRNVTEYNVQFLMDNNAKYAINPNHGSYGLTNIRRVL